jgi:uncharacterized protein
MKMSRFNIGLMHRIALPLSLGLAALLSSQISHAAAPTAQPTAPLVDVDPALWVVRDDDTTIYLFGTIHVLKPGLGWFDEAVRDAFDASDSLVVEMVDPQESATFSSLEKYALDKSGKTLRSKLSPAQKKAYTEALIKLAIPADDFDPLKPWFAAINIEMSNLVARGYNPESGVETILEAAAKTAKKPIFELESFDAQMQLMDSLPDASQMDLLMSSTESVTATNDEMDMMVTSWGKSDLSELGKIMNDGLKDPILRDTMLTKRNTNWAAWINTRMAEPGTVFLAVGAGHLTGDDSVQKQLEAYKITSERVVY